MEPRHYGTLWNINKVNYQDVLQGKQMHFVVVNYQDVLQGKQMHYVVVNWHQDNQKKDNWKKDNWKMTIGRMDIWKNGQMEEWTFGRMDKTGQCKTSAQQITREIDALRCSGIMQVI